MATIGTELTLMDWAKRLDPDGNTADIAEILSEENEILDDMVWVEGNLPTGHRTTVRTGLPEPTWRKLYEGVQPSKSQTTQVTDSCGMLEDYGQVDKSLADLNGNTPEFRLSEERGFLEGISQEMAETVFYGDTDTSPQTFMGLAPRYSDTTASNGANIIDGGGVGSDNTSIWLIGWAPKSVHGIYPKGSKMGLTMTDKGQITLDDGNGGLFEGYRTHYKWDAGLCVRDWRYVVRIANIDVSDLSPDQSSGADLQDLMSAALEQIQNLNGVRPAFYVNRTIRGMLRRQVRKTSNVHLDLDTHAGKSVLRFDEVPVRRCDQILTTESAVS